MREYIGMSEDSFNNHLSQLRKKGVLDKDNKITKVLTDNYPETDKMEINYKIIIR